MLRFAQHDKTQYDFINNKIISIIRILARGVKIFDKIFLLIKIN